MSHPENRRPGARPSPAPIENDWTKLLERVTDAMEQNDPERAFGGLSTLFEVDPGNRQGRALLFQLLERTSSLPDQSDVSAALYESRQFVKKGSFGQATLCLESAAWRFGETEDIAQQRTLLEHLAAERLRGQDTSGFVLRHKDDGELGEHERRQVDRILANEPLRARKPSEANQVQARRGAGRRSTTAPFEHAADAIRRRPYEPSKNPLPSAPPSRPEIREAVPPRLRKPPTDIFEAKTGSFVLPTSGLPTENGPGGPLSPPNWLDRLKAFSHRLRGNGR